MRLRLVSETDAKREWTSRCYASLGEPATHVPFEDNCCLGLRLSDCSPSRTPGPGRKVPDVGHAGADHRDGP